MLKRNRPISPHLLIYTPTLNLQRSIFHRLTGLSLAFFFTCLFLSLNWLLILTPFWTNMNLLFFTFLTINFFKNLIFCVVVFHIWSGLRQLLKSL